MLIGSRLSLRHSRAGGNPGFCVAKLGLNLDAGFRRHDGLSLRLNAQHAQQKGVALLYFDLDLGKVSVVIPISSTGPFFSLILTVIFLRDVERVTFRIVVSAAMIVGGVLLISWWK